jgi:solute carrier family 35 protein
MISLAVCVFYGASSLAIGLVNKALLSSYNFNCIFFLLATQMLLQLIMCLVSRDFFSNPFKVPKYDRATHVLSLRLGILYVANVAVGLIGLSMVNVPMFFCIRRLVSPMILFYEYLFLNKVADTNVQGAVALIVAGTVMAGWDTLNSDIRGYAVTFVNNLCTAASSSSQKQFSDTTKLGAVGTLFYTSLTAFPLCVLLAVLTGEVPALIEFPHLFDSSFWFGFIVSLSLGPLLTYSSILCTTYNSPLAMSITGNVKDVASTSLGAILFPGFLATPKTLGGLALSFAGAGFYSYINLQKGLKSAAAVGGGGGGGDKQLVSGSTGSATAPSVNEDDDSNTTQSTSLISSTISAQDSTTGMRGRA